MKIVRRRGYRLRRQLLNPRRLHGNYAIDILWRSERESVFVEYIQRDDRTGDAGLVFPTQKHEPFGLRRRKVHNRLSLPANGHI